MMDVGSLFVYNFGLLIFNGGKTLESVRNLKKGWIF